MKCLQMDNEQKEEKLRQVRSIVDGLDKQTTPHKVTGRMTRLVTARSDADLSTTTAVRHAITPNPKRVNFN
jgi:hypothetical protein